MLERSISELGLHQVFCLISLNLLNDLVICVLVMTSSSIRVWKGNNAHPRRVDEVPTRDVNRTRMNLSRSLEDGDLGLGAS